MRIITGISNGIRKVWVAKSVRVHGHDKMHYEKWGLTFSFPNFRRTIITDQRGCVRLARNLSWRDLTVLLQGHAQLILTV
jgi:hypothetical protein